MSFVHFFLLDHLFIFIVFYCVECVRAIWLQLILLPFCPVVIFVLPDVDNSIITPMLPLPIGSRLFVNLCCIELPFWDISVVLQWVYMLCVAIRVEVSHITLRSWSSILHVAHQTSLAPITDPSEGSVVKCALIEHTHSLKWEVFIIRVFVGDDS